MRKLGLAAALAIGLSACGGGGGGDGAQPAVTCNWLPGSPECSTTSGPLDQTQKDQLDALCVDWAGTPSDGATCPSTNLIGSCTYTQAPYTVEYRYYATPAGWNATTAQADCLSVTGAVWHPAN